MTERAILHIDMNNFYASVECMLNPELKPFPNQKEFEGEFKRINANITELHQIIEVEKTKIRPTLDIESRLDRLFEQITAASADMRTLRIASSANWSHRSEWRVPKNSRSSSTMDSAQQPKSNPQ